MLIEDKTFDEERALYGSTGLTIRHCAFDGPADVEARIITPVISIKNPKSGTIYVPSVGEIIRDDVQSEGRIVTGGGQSCLECA